MLYIRINAVIVILLHFISLRSQSVKIGSIDIYGNRNLSSQAILKLAGISEGDSIGQQLLLNRTIEKNIEHAAGVKFAKTALVCCDKNGNYHLFIGVAENDSTILFHRDNPKLRIRLPAHYMHAYAQFSARLSDAVQSGQSREDWEYGHSMIQYPPARKIQEKYKIWADEDFAVLSKVLRSSAYAQERATAAQIIAYYFDKNKAIPELMYAIIDESDEVRNNAIRAIAVIAYYSSLHPEKKINIPSMPFIRLINSVVWSDRNKGLSVLMQLTQSRDTVLLNQLKQSPSFEALKEMAVWKSESHALPAYVILARIAGIPEDEIFKTTTGTNFADEAMKLAKAIQ
ncbi:MAG TPA: HEAT repeat domain-containing protein [Flavitalea sp.]|nr:HEAT repeat domain-containing protein [Flavitalea sp.]